MEEDFDGRWHFMEDNLWWKMTFPKEQKHSAKIKFLSTAQRQLVLLKRHAFPTFTNIECGAHSVLFLSSIIVKSLYPWIHWLHSQCLIGNKISLFGLITGHYLSQMGHMFDKCLQKKLSHLWWYKDPNHSIGNFSHNWGDFGKGGSTIGISKHFGNTLNLIINQSVKAFTKVDQS